MNKYHIMADCTLEARNIDEAQKILGEWLLADTKSEQPPSPIKTGAFSIVRWGTYRPMHPGQSGSVFSDWVGD